MRCPGKKTAPTLTCRGCRTFEGFDTSARRYSVTVPQFYVTFFFFFKEKKKKFLFSRLDGQQSYLPAIRCRSHPPLPHRSSLQAARDDTIYTQLGIAANKSDRQPVNQRIVGVFHMKRI